MKTYLRKVSVGIVIGRDRWRCWADGRSRANRWRTILITSLTTALATVRERWKGFASWLSVEVWAVRVQRGDRILRHGGESHDLVSNDLDTSFSWSIGDFFTTANTGRVGLIGSNDDVTSWLIACRRHWFRDTGFSGTYCLLLFQCKYHITCTIWTDGILLQLSCWSNNHKMSPIVDEGEECRTLPFNRGEETAELRSFIAAWTKGNLRSHFMQLISSLGNLSSFSGLAVVVDVSEQLARIFSNSYGEENRSW